MKEYFDVNALVNAYNAALSGWVILLTTIFGEYWYLFAAFLFFHITFRLILRPFPLST